MEAELVHLRKELEAKLIQTRYENSYKILDKIITSQRDPSNKNRIGYSQQEIQFSSVVRDYAPNNPRSGVANILNYLHTIEF